MPQVDDGDVDIVPVIPQSEHQTGFTAIDARSKSYYMVPVLRIVKWPTFKLPLAQNPSNVRHRVAPMPKLLLKVGCPNDRCPVRQDPLDDLLSSS